MAARRTGKGGGMTGFGIVGLGVVADFHRLGILANRDKGARLAAVAGTAGMALIAATIVLSQIRHRYAANAGWPLEWEHLHRLGLLVVVLLAASTLSEWVRPRPPSDDAATAPPR